MELDDFKKAWKKDSNINVTPELLSEKITQIEKSGKKIRSTFVIELAIIAGVYLFFIGVIAIFNGQIQSFLYKLVVMTFIGFSPTAYRLYQSQRRINAMDYSTDIRSNLISFLTYYRTTIKWYWWSCVITSICMFTMLFTDNDFLTMDVEWQIGICAYIIIVLLLTRPYLNKTYGIHAKNFEALLQ